MDSDSDTTKRKLEECGTQSTKKIRLDGNISNDNQSKDDHNIKTLCKSRSVESYSKLHRLDKLVSSLLIALRNAVGNTKVLLPAKLSKKWCDAFRQHMTTLSSSQIINIFRSLLWSLNEDCIKPLESNPLDTSCLRILPIVSHLLCLYLSKVHMAEHTVPVVMVGKFVDHMDELQNLLGRLGCALLHKEHDHTLMDAFLSSCLSWGDVRILMLQYRPQDEMTEVWNSTTSDSSATNFSGFHPYLSSDQWSLVAQRITNFGDLVCKCLLNQLVVQKFEVLVLFVSDPCVNVLSAAVKHLVIFMDDGWPQVLGDNGCLLLSHLDTTLLLKLAQHVVKDIVNGDCSVEALQKPGIQENKQLISAVAIVTIIDVLKPWSNAKKKGNMLTPCSRMIKDVYKTLDPHLVVDSVRQSLDCTDIVSNMAGIINTFLDIGMDMVATGLLDGRNSPPVIPHLHAGLLIRRLLETDLQLSPCQHQQLLHLLFIQSLEDPLSLRHLEDGIPLLRKGGAETELHPKHIDAAAVLQKTFQESSHKVSKAVCSEEQKVQCRTIRRRLTRNLVAILKCSNMGDNQNLSSKLQLKIIHVALQEYIAKKKKPKLDIISPFLGTVLNEALVGVSNGDQECINLVGILLRNHAQLEKALPADFLLQASAVLSNANASIELQKILLKAANLSQFKSITQELLKVTMNSTSGLSTKPGLKVEGFPTMWTSMVMSDLNDRKCQVRQVALLQLYTLLLTSVQLGHFTDIQTLLRFNLAVVNCHQVSLKPEMLDCCLESITALELENLTSVVLALQLLSSLLSHCSAQVLDTIPAFVQRFSHLVAIVAKQGSQNENSTDAKYDQIIETCGLSIEKLASSMVKYDKQFHRIAQYIVANILYQFEVFTLQLNVKLHLTNAVYSFFSICDTHAIAYLTHELPPASKEIFRTFYNNYKKYYRYTGKL